MKKIYILTILTATSIMLVNAEETATTVVKKPLPPQASQQAQMMRQINKEKQDVKQLGNEQAKPPMMSTGDTAVDAQIKALNKEMEEKIKAIREDYMARIKVIIGDRKQRVASTTPRRMEEDGRLARPMMGTSTNERLNRPEGGQVPVAPMMRDGGQVPVAPMMREGEVKGESTGPVNQRQGSAIQNFFRGIWSR